MKEFYEALSYLLKMDKSNDKLDEKIKRDWDGLDYS